MQPTGEQSKLVYDGSLWCVSNYLQAVDDQEQPIYSNDGKPQDDSRLTGKTNLLRRDQVSAASKEEAEQKVTKVGLFEQATQVELRKALDDGATDFFIHHFNQGATSPGPCIGSGGALEGMWINDAIRENCFDLTPEPTPTATPTKNEDNSSGATTATNTSASEVPVSTIDNSQAQLKLISEATVDGSAQSVVNASRKAEMIAQMKAVYLDLIQKFPEIKSKRLSSFFITEEDKSDPNARGHIQEGEGTNQCKIGLDFDIFGKGNNVTTALKGAEFHEFLHCWSGIFTSSTVPYQDSLLFSTGESVVWPIAGSYSGELSLEADWYGFWEAMTDVFIARGDKGDRWRILMAVIGEGRKGLDKRLSFLPLPESPLNSPFGNGKQKYSSPSDYVDYIANWGKYDEGIKWLKSKTPPPANYKIYNFNK